MSCLAKCIELNRITAELIVIRDHEMNFFGDTSVKDSLSEAIQSVHEARLIVHTRCTRSGNASRQ
jgi:hypothetical protein